MQTTNLTIEVRYDPEKTDPEALSGAFDRLLETVLSTPGILDEYGPVEVGDFRPGKPERAPEDPPEAPEDLTAWAVVQPTRTTQWIRCGTARPNRDGSVDVLLDALPLSGELHLRPQTPRSARKAKGD